MDDDDEYRRKWAIELLLTIADSDAALCDVCAIADMLVIYVKTGKRPPRSAPREET